MLVEEGDAFLQASTYVLVGLPIAGGIGLCLSRVTGLYSIATAVALPSCYGAYYMCHSTYKDYILGHLVQLGSCRIDSHQRELLTCDPQDLANGRMGLTFAFMGTVVAIFFAVIGGVSEKRRDACSGAGCFSAVATMLLIWFSFTGIVIMNGKMTAYDTYTAYLGQAHHYAGLLYGCAVAFGGVALAVPALPDRCTRAALNSVAIGITFSGWLTFLVMVSTAESKGKNYCISNEASAWNLDEENDGGIDFRILGVIPLFATVGLSYKAYQWRQAEAARPEYHQLLA